MSNVELALLELAPAARWRIDWDDEETPPSYTLHWLDLDQLQPSEAAITAKLAEISSRRSPDYPAFRNAIAQLPAWRSLIATDGRANELSRCLGEQDLATAIIWWDDLVDAGKIPPELKADILAAAISANMPQALLDKLQ